MKKKSEVRQKKPGKAKPAQLRYLSQDVPEQFVFYVSDGTVLKNLKDTVKALRKMDDGTFSYHANREKNDFANWIRDVLGHHHLAYNIIGKNRQGTAAEIISYAGKKTGKKMIL